MTSTELSVTDPLGIPGTVLADHEDGVLHDYEILNSVEPENYSPTWSQVESALDNKLDPWCMPVWLERIEIK